MDTIAIITQKLKGDGAEHMAANLSLMLRDKYSIIIIAFDGTGVSFPYAGTLIDLNLGVKKGRLAKALTMIRRIRQTRKIKKEYSVDVSISFLPSPNLVNVLSRGDDKIVTSIRNYSSIDITSSFWKRMVSFSCKHSDSVVSLSNAVRDDLVDSFDCPIEKVTTIYNSVDGDLLLESATPVTNNLPKRYAIAIGRLHAQKGHWHLIRAFSEVINSIPDMHLVIIGEGELEPALKLLVDEYALSNRVHFLGYINAPYHYLANAEAMIFPSLFEGLGSVILEAMACGVPVVSADCLAGPRELLADGSNDALPSQTEIGYEILPCGVLVPAFPLNDLDTTRTSLSDEEEVLANAMIRVLNDDDLKKRLSDNARKAVEKYSPQIISAQWQELIRKL